MDTIDEAHRQWVANGWDAAADGMAVAFPVRRVVTGHDDRGRPTFLSDGVPPQTVTSPSGHGLSELLWLEALPIDPDDGGDPPPDLRGSYPVGGALACRLIRFPGFAPHAPIGATWLRMPGDDPARPGMHRSETLDLMVVVDGHITLGLDDGEHLLGPGDVVVQRGTPHRWRVVGERPCTFLSVLLSPDDKAPTPHDPLGVPDLEHGSHDVVGGPRRLVTGMSPDGRSGVAPIAAPKPPVTVGPSEVTLYDLWQTGGPLTHVSQGGDAAGPWSLEPAGRGVAFRRADWSVTARG